MSLRRIIEERSGATIVSTIAAIAAGGAIAGGYAAGVFNGPPPACYIASPSSGASVVGSQSLTATCGASTVLAQFAVDGSVVASDAGVPFTSTWNSASIADGSHSVAVISCDVNSSCVTSQAVSFTTANVPHAPVNTAAPVVTGGLAVGNVDSCSNGTWTGDTTGGFTYQWKDGAGNISGQTAATYTLAVGEVGASLHCTVTASGGSGSASASSVAVGPVVAAGALTANVWISPTGSNIGANCNRTAATTAPSAANACATPQKACNLAQSGDTVGVMAGMYTIGFALDNTCTQNITFQTVAGAFADFELYGSIDATNVTLQGDVVGQGVGFSLGNMGVTGTNIVWNDINLYCQDASEASGNWVQLFSAAANEYGCNDSISIGATGFTWNGGDQEDWATCGASVCTRSNAPGGNNPNDDFVNPTASNILIENVTFKNHYGIGTTAQLHDEAWFLYGGNHITFLNDRLLDCAPPASTGYPVASSCDSAYMFVGFLASTNTTDYLSIIQSIIAPGSHGVAQKAFQWGHVRPTGYEYHFTAEYDDFDHSLTMCFGSGCDGGTGVTGANVTMVGNVGLRSSTACGSAETDIHNTWFNPTGNAAKCSATDSQNNSIPDTTFWTAPDSFDFSPLAVIQAAGENAVCATLPTGADINGKARPVSSPACDAGAIQH